MMTTVNTDNPVGWVVDIQHYCIHDGPGIRTTVFLGGCPLNCLWCSNPESLQVGPRIVHWEERCVQCGACLATCPNAAIEQGSNGRKRILADRCDLCGWCIDECCASALEQMGRGMTVQEVMVQVEADYLPYQASGGGLTLSGGEPTSQPEFSRRLLQRCRERGIHTAVETCGDASWRTWQALLPYMDLVLYDVKEVDPDRHRRYTGRSNERILENLHRLATSGVPLVLRRPLIPGHNDDEESIRALAALAQGLETVDEIHLLPYHRLGQAKYWQMGIEYTLGDLSPQNGEQIESLRDILAGYGSRVMVGG